MDKIKPYSVLMGCEYFDWNKAIEGKILGLDIGVSDDILALKAKNWVTCAVGNQCASIPRLGEGSCAPNAPKDDLLSTLGCHFFHRVHECDWHKAKQTLERIEARSIELLTLQSKEKGPLHG